MERRPVRPRAWQRTSGTKPSSSGCSAGMSMRWAGCPRPGHGAGRPLRSISWSPDSRWTRSSAGSAPTAAVDLVGRSFGIIKFTVRKQDLRHRPAQDGHRQPTSRPAATRISEVAADPALPVEKDLERRDFRVQQHGPEAGRRRSHRPVRRPGRHPGAAHPADEPRGLSRGPAPGAPGGPVLAPSSGSPSTRRSTRSPRKSTSTA